MAYAFLTVKVEYKDHSFINSPSAAKSMIEAVLNRDHRCRAVVVGFDTAHGEENLLGDVRSLEADEDVVDDEYASGLIDKTRLRNIFDR